MREEKQSYSRILKSSSIVGGAQGFNLLLGMVRVKFVAVLLGPAGLGLLGLLQTIQATASTVSGLGVNSSGVRDVAEANGADDEIRLAQTVITLRRVCWLTGSLGALALVVLAKPLSQLTFQSTEYASEISWLGLAIFLSAVSTGQMALIQGMRRIGDLARLNIISAVTGTIIAILLYGIMGVAGIVPAILILAGVNLTTSVWYSRKIKIAKVEMTWLESLLNAKGLISLGLAFMWSGLLVAIVDYATRVLIAQEANLAAVGIFAASFSLSGMFINFILGAMAADYYPSLTAISNDHVKMRDLVNRQTEIGLLLAVPGLLATLAMAPWVIRFFYTSEFLQSADLLQWFVLGCLGRVISWPMGFILLAKGKGKLFAASQTLVNFIHIGLIWLGLKWYGIEGVAMAFCVLYIFHICWLMTLSRHLIQFKWSESVKRLLVFLLPIAVIIFVQSRFFSLIPATMIGAFVTIVTGGYCLRGLCLRLGRGHAIVRRILLIPGARFLCKV